ncbi:MAG: hypothetical protein LVQ97_02335 [Candidatus Micrarchaeales archaeon]|jgi:hypothetical protein|nr:hypothetical protein [Candidatus Micrarchaeales archaeon]
MRLNKTHIKSSAQSETSIVEHATALLPIGYCMSVFEHGKPIDAKLVEKLSELSNSTFSDLYPDLIEAAIKRKETLFVITDVHEEPVAAAGMNYNCCHPAGHFTLGFVRMEDRGRGLYAALDRIRLEKAVLDGCKFIRVTTQNPIVERTLKNELTAMVYSNRIAGFDMLRTTFENVYKGPLLGKNGWAKDRNGAPIKYKDLNYENGDVCAIDVKLLLRR